MEVYQYCSGYEKAGKFDLQVIFFKKLNQFFFCDGGRSKVFFAIDFRDKFIETIPCT